MQEKTLPLESILLSFTKFKKNQTPHKRTLFNKGPIGGKSSAQLILFFFSLPFIEYAAIFNPFVFSKLGIAQSIIFYIIFMSIIIMIIFVVAMRNNKKVIKTITPSWEYYFPNIDLKMVLSSGHSPYRDFFKHLSTLVVEDYNEKSLHKGLLTAFETMKEENSDLLEAIQKDRQNSQK
ncbi:MAG: hypothetical protein OEW60_08025 [Thiovulaceae bacterium]|nr:hypothetical protein [Sulfurimonadaceae bacterium]